MSKIYVVAEFDVDEEFGEHDYPVAYVAEGAEQEGGEVRILNPGDSEYDLARSLFEHVP